MTPLLIALAVACQGPSLAENHYEELNPALRLTMDQAKQDFDRCYSQASKDTSPDKVMNQVRRSIGGGQGPSGSYVWALPPEFQIYEQAYYSRKQGLPKEAVTRVRFDLAKRWAKPEALAIRGSIGLPATDSQAPTASDVRVELKVGDKVYEPNTQPGDVRAVAYEASYWAARDGRPILAPSAGGHYKFSMLKHVRWMQAPFLVSFELFNDDGSPRISTNDKEVTVSVEYGHLRQEVKYSLDEWLRRG
jgi:hypothetical protein